MGISDGIPRLLLSVALYLLSTPVLPLGGFLLYLSRHDKLGRHGFILLLDSWDGTHESETEHTRPILLCFV